MDLYFHNSPKKGMFLSSSKKKRTGSAVGPELSLQQHQKKLVTVLSAKSVTVTVTDYLQKKVNATHAKKIWNQMIPYNIRQKGTASGSSKSSSTILFDSTEHLSTVSTPPTPPPKKSHTMPNLVIITNNTDPLMYRALPSLPSIASSTSIGGMKNGITKATTWVGNSIQKWLSSADAEEKRKMAVLMDHSELDEEEEQNILYSSTLLPNALSKKMTLHCRILQVTNLASSKNYQYMMHMRVTNNTTQTHSGVMKRVAKGISAAHPRAALSFDVQGRFQLECDLSIKPCSTTNIVDRIKSLTSKTNLSNIANAPTTAVEESEEENEDTTIKGQLVLDSGDEPLSSFANKGIGRYSIQTSTLLALELTVAFWLEENNETLEDEEEDLCTPIDQDVLRYCQAGDYLTFYVKGESYPMWIRYWVSYRNNQLILRSNERGGGEPVDKVSLKHLSNVNINPSDDIQEEIYLGKKYGIVLTFGKSNMYLFGDNCKSVRFWKCLLEQQKCNNTTATHAMIENKIAKKYLWFSSVAQ